MALSVRPSLRDSQMRSSSSDFGSIAITVRPLSAQPRFLRRKVVPEIPAIFKDKQLAAVLRLTRKVTPDTPLASEQKRLVAAVAAKKAARCESKRLGRGEQPPDAHLLRPEPFYSQTVTPLMRAIMELTLITVRPPDPKPPQSERIGPPWGSPCGGRLPSSPQMSKPPLSSASKPPSSPPSKGPPSSPSPSSKLCSSPSSPSKSPSSKWSSVPLSPSARLSSSRTDSMSAAGGSTLLTPSIARPALQYRVTTADDDEAEADERRRRVYALNEVMRKQHRAQWQAYQKRRGVQMGVLERCLANGAMTIARRALTRLAERCERVREDEVCLAEYEAQREARTLTNCVSCVEPSPEDEEMIRAMAVDESTGPARIRFCPWHSTVAGCPRLSSCPLSHSKLPVECATWRYRYWALEGYDGWIGEACNVERLTLEQLAHHAKRAPSARKDTSSSMPPAPAPSSPQGSRRGGRPTVQAQHEESELLL